MTMEADDEDTTLAPDDAFAVLGNETRIQILRELGTADEPLPFSELLDRVEMGDSGNFNYHLDKLVGHFIEDTENGYQLQKAGERVIEAVLSGAITESPKIQPTQIDRPCHLCGAPIEVSYQEEWVALSCTECAGVYGESAAEDDDLPLERMHHGYLGGQPLPPAGVKDRTPFGVLQAADTWSSLVTLGASSGICPRCSAPIDWSMHVCEDHDASAGLCEECDHRHAAQVEQFCTNCPYDAEGVAVIGLAANTDLLTFQTSHGFNPLSPTPDFYRVMLEYDEEILATDPLEARFTWTIDGDSLSMTVDEDLNVVGVERSQASDTD